MTDSGHVGIGEAALAPRVTKQVIDLYLKPILIGQNPFDSEFLWQHMYRSTLAFGRKGIGMVAISAVDIGIWDLLGKIQNQPIFRLLGGKTKAKIPVYASRLYSQPLPEIAGEARNYKEQGFRAMKLRFGWGPLDGAAGMQHNLDLVRRSGKRRIRRRSDGGCLHGLDAGLRSKDDSPSRKVSAPLGGRARDSR